MAKFMTQDDAVVPMQHPSLLVECALSRGAQLADLLCGTGIAPGALRSPDARMTFRQFGRLALNALESTGDATLGLHFGSRIRIHHQGMLGLLVMSSATLGEAVDACLAYHATVSPAWDIRLERHGDRAHLVLRQVLPMGRLLAFSTEATLVSYDNAFRALVPSFRPREVHVEHPRPAHADAYTFGDGCRVHFDSDSTELVFDAALLDEPLAAPDPVTAELARRQCAAALPPAHRNLLTRIRDHLDGRPGCYPSMQELASSLGTSPRSLRRHLRALSTNYQTLVDEARRRHAETAVSSTAMTVQQLADFLGYGDARGFRRAWRRWTGQTPSGYRAALHA